MYSLHHSHALDQTLVSAFEATVVRVPSAAQRTHPHLPLSTFPPSRKSISHTAPEAFNAYAGYSDYSCSMPGTVPTTHNQHSRGVIWEPYPLIRDVVKVAQQPVTRRVLIPAVSLPPSSSPAHRPPLPARLQKPQQRPTSPLPLPLPPPLPPPLVDVMNLRPLLLVRVVDLTLLVT